MPAIASGQSQNITIQAGEVLNFDALGAGSAVIANGQEAGTAYNIGTSAVAIGPFTSSRTISVSVSSSISYFIGAAQIDIIATRTPPDNSPTLSGASAGAVQDAALVGAVSRYAYAVLVPGQADSQFDDISGNGRDLLVEPANTAAFSNAGYMSTTTATRGGLVIPASRVAWNPAKEFLIFHVTAKLTLGTGFVLASFAYSGLTTGLQIEVTAGGKIQIAPRNTGGDKNKTAVSRLGVTAGVDVAVTVMFDPLTGSLYLYRDGALSNSYVGNNYPGGVNALPDANTVAMVSLGGSSGAASGTTAQQYKAVHIYKGAGALPNSCGSIARAMAANPLRVVPESMFVPFSERFLLGIGPGQSNEAGGQGGASDYYAVNSGDGGPLVDGVSVLGGTNYNYNTAWPALAGAVGRRKKWMDVLNFARGTTGLVSTWVGCLRAYVASPAMLVTPGSYVLSSNGRVYKAIGTLGNVYTLNTDPSNGVGSSGLSSWTDLGLARARDVDGYVYPPTDAYFDPNGILAVERTELLNRPGYSKKAHLISIGQTDTTTLSTRQQYSLAIQYVAQFFTSVGIHTFVGMTSTSTGSDARFTSDLRPGRLDALAALAGNPLVHDGGDIAALGILPNETNAQPAAMLTTPALLNNGGVFVHFNAAAQKLTVPIRDAALAAAGF